MNTRKRTLPPGWYPGNPLQTSRAIEGMLKNIKIINLNAIAGVAPHAGWDFSGKIALQVLKALDPKVESIIVIGGHLYPSDKTYAAREKYYETPLGEIEADYELLGILDEQIELLEDRYADNTVEIQLPFIKFLFPNAKALWLRTSPSELAIELGRAIASVSKQLNRKVAVLGSTDLTHYGMNYGFSPVGHGAKAVQWVKEVNDKGFLDLLLSFQPEKAIKHAIENKSACSAGAAAASLSFAKAMGCNKSKLLSYQTSYDIYPGESFVGYGGLVFYTESQQK